MLTRFFNIQATKSSRGFTIVELLIVIIVIGILAAIVIVAFNGVQQRANNTSRISAANSTLKLVRAYQAAYGQIPLASGANFCATVDNICSSWDHTANPSNNATLMTEFRKIGQPIQSIPRVGGDDYGILYNVWTDPSRGDAILHMFYWLEGRGQQCGAEGATGTNESSNVTRCTMRVSGTR